MTELSKIRNDAKQAQFQEMIKNSFTTKIRTSFIFPLAEFERMFGYLWGHEVMDKSTLTDNQIAFYKMYMIIRKTILDNGNNQIRMLQDEIDQCEVNFKRNK